MRVRLRRLKLPGNNAMAGLVPHTVMAGLGPALSFRDGAKRRTRNPDTGTALASGFQFLIAPRNDGAESSQNFRIKIAPIEICLLDQLDLPPSPFFNFFFTFDCVSRVVITFKPDKTFDIVPLGEAMHDLLLVLTNAANEITRYAKI